MASVSVSHLILFIASIVVAASVAGVFTTEITRLGGAIDDQSVAVSQDVRTDVEIISDGGSPVYNTSGNENITLLVKNIGTRRLPTEGSHIDVLVNGVYQTNVTITPIDTADWRPGSVAEFEIDGPVLEAGDHRVKIVVNTDEEVFEFRR